MWNIITFKMTDVYLKRFTNILLSRQSTFSAGIIVLLYYGAVECLNLIGWRTFWGVQLFSGKCTANVVPDGSLDHITVPYHFAKWFILFQRSYNRKITKTNNNTGQTNKCIKQKDTIDRFFSFICHKIWQPKYKWNNWLRAVELLEK